LLVTLVPLTVSVKFCTALEPTPLLAVMVRLYTPLLPGSGVPEIGSPGESGFGTLVQGYLESSNVNVVEEMVAMILAQRAYELNSKSIQTSDEMLQRVSQLKR